jgi:hypothetical protein
LVGSPQPLFFSLLVFRHLHLREVGHDAGLSFQEVLGLLGEKLIER